MLILIVGRILGLKATEIGVLVLDVGGDGMTGTADCCFPAVDSPGLDEDAAWLW